MQRGKLPFWCLEIDWILKRFKLSSERVFKGGPRESNEPLKQEEAQTLPPRSICINALYGWVGLNDLNVSDDVSHTILTTHAIQIFDCTLTNYTIAQYVKFMVTLGDPKGHLLFQVGQALSWFAQMVCMCKRYMDGTTIKHYLFCHAVGDATRTWYRKKTCTLVY